MLFYIGHLKIQWHSGEQILQDKTEKGTCQTSTAIGHSTPLSLQI